MFATDLNIRFEAWTGNSVVRALAMSLAAHLLLFGFIELGYRLGLWRIQVLPFEWSQRALAHDAESQTRTNPTDSKEAEVPMVFVEVEPSQTADTVPDDAKYYSSENSIAGNPDTRIDSGAPKISGAQDVVPKTTDTPRPAEAPAPEPAPLQPEPLSNQAKAADAQPLRPAPAEQPRTIEEPEPGPEPGALAVEPPHQRTLYPKPAFTRDPPPRLNPPRRYRRLADARAAQSSLAGRKMKQEGGVKRYSIDPSLDVKATPFGAYDRAIIDAIQKRWFDLLDERDYAQNATGKVVLTFRLNSNGTVTELTVMENRVTEILSLLCQRAVLDPSPYAPWPMDMRRAIGANHRLVRFTFHYE